jgi:hypothetical protein
MMRSHILFFIKEREANGIGPRGTHFQFSSAEGSE